MKNLISLLIIALLSACGTVDELSNEQSIAVDSKAFAETIKYSEGDPFIETIKKSEFFKLSGLEDKVVETTNGTIISIPKGAFRDNNGNIVEKEVTIEITDIASFEEQFNANITSPAGQNILLNGGAIYLNATKDGAQLSLNDDAPIYIETQQKSNPDLLVFEGIRNDKGEMQWINPKQPKKYLIPVALNELDFLPEGFANEVEKNMPFGNYKITTKELTDSLYYSLGLKFEVESSDETAVTELANVNAYSSNYSSDQLEVNNDTTAVAYCLTIIPASVKVIKGKKFANTLIATKQFEERMQVIHRTREQKALEIYTSNLTKDLSYCDSLAGNLFGVGSTFELRFRTFSQENWSNIENLPRSVQKLGDYYTANLKKVSRELEAAKRKYEKALAEKSAKAEKIREDYRKLLTKRLKYRMKRHGFIPTKMGWYGIGKIIEPITIDLNVKNGADFDRVHVYTIDPGIKSIFSWQSTDKVNFNYGFAEDALLIYNKGAQAKALVVAYKGDVPYFDMQDFRAEKDVEINFSLHPTTKSKLKRKLSELDNGSKRFNNIKVDLAYQASFYNEKRRLKKVMNERRVIANLAWFVYRCSK